MRILAYSTVATLTAAALVLVAWTQQRRLLYFPEPNVGLLPVDWAEVIVATESGLDLVAWHRSSAAERAPIVVVFHGNGGNRADRLPLGDALVARGFEVLLVDYRGYGGNPGSPSEEGIADDARSAARTAAALAPDRKIVYFGESLGAAVATRLAVEMPPDALVLRSPFSSLSDVGRFHYPWAPSVLYRESYPSLVRCESGALERVPVLVLAGTADSVIPVAQSKAIAEAAGAEWHEVSGADHNDPSLQSDPAFVDRVARFINQSVAESL